MGFIRSVRVDCDLCFESEDMTLRVRESDASVARRARKIGWETYKMTTGEYIARCPKCVRMNRQTPVGSDFRRMTQEDIENLRKDPVWAHLLVEAGE